ncbi:hypothetical protein Tco_0973647, partial [Tanacetum coccineum]
MTDAVSLALEMAQEDGDVVASLWRRHNHLHIRFSELFRHYTRHSNRGCSWEDRVIRNYGLDFDL